MGKKLTILGVVSFAVIAVSAFLLRNHTFAVLQPAGEISQRELDILLFGAGLSLFVVIPVFILTFYIVWKYRADKKAAYLPEWDHSRSFEAIWWAVPIVLIAILSVITWKSSHSLDPFKPIVSDKKPLKVQVVALQWKWLFIYPEQNVASVNFAQIPLDTPVRFEITSDAPMNAFWVPQLGSQIYAMAGMSSQLNLIANKTGDYVGVSSNISGKGFADMHFTVRSSTEADFGAWVRDAKNAPQRLSFATYNDLAQPTQNNPVASYSSVDPNLYDTIVMKYMSPTGSGNNKHEMDY